ncbi:hypothetical protein Tco_1166175 [Tanacetum coccineum]
MRSGTRRLRGPRAKHARSHTDSLASKDHRVEHFLETWGRFDSTGIAEIKTTQVQKEMVGITHRQAYLESTKLKVLNANGDYTSTSQAPPTPSIKWRGLKGKIGHVQNE